MASSVTSATVSYELREYVYQRDHGHCQYCGATGPGLITEHVVPFLQGGHTAPYNLVLACVPCNYGKRGRTVVPGNIAVLAQESPDWAATIRHKAAEPPEPSREVVSYKILPDVARRLRKFAHNEDRPIGHVAEEARLEFLERHGG